MKICWVYCKSLYDAKLYYRRKLIIIVAEQLYEKNVFVAYTKGTLKLEIRKTLLELLHQS